MVAGMAAFRSTFFGGKPPPREAIVAELTQASLHGFSTASAERSSRAGRGLSASGAGHRLHLEVLLETRDAVLATDAAGLVAAERDVRAVGSRAVEPDAPGSEPAGHGHRRSSEPDRM